MIKTVNVYVRDLKASIEGKQKVKEAQQAIADAEKKREQLFAESINAQKEMAAYFKSKKGEFLF